MTEQERAELKRRREMDHPWHVAIIRFHDDARERGEYRSPFMYEAKRAFQEVPRMIYWLRTERLGQMPKMHQQCSMQAPEPLPENVLTCCLGVECRKCPELLAIEAADITPEESDEAKAWTCAAHILMKGGDTMGEGYILTTGDRVFWDRTYANLAAAFECDAQVPDSTKTENT